MNREQQIELMKNSKKNKEEAFERAKPFIKESLKKYVERLKELMTFGMTKHEAYQQIHKESQN